MIDIRTDWQAFLASPREATFIPVFERTRGLVWTLCRRILDNDEDAADAFQSAYARLIAEAARGAGIPSDAGGGQEPGHILYRLAIREAQNLKRRQARRAAREAAMEHLEAIPSGGSAAADIAARRQLRERLESLVGQLPEPLRLPVQLHYFHGLSQVEIGRLLNITQGHASRRIAKGLRKLEPLARRAGLAEALPSLAIIATAGALLEAPEALSAGAVYAQAQAVLAAGGAATASGGLGALAGKLLAGTVVLKKAAILTGAAVLAVGVLMAGKQLMASASDDNAAVSKEGAKIAASTATPKTTPTPGVAPQAMTKNLSAGTAPVQKPMPSGVSSAGASPLAPPSQAGSPRLRAQRPERMAPITGRIVDAESGKPIAGAEVTLVNEQKSRSDARGVYRFDSGPVGTVSVAAEGYVDQVDNLPMGATAAITADFTLDPAVTVAFQVRDERGAPVPNASMNLYTVERPRSPTEPPQRLRLRPVKTDAHGVAIARKISRLRPLEVTMTRFGYRMQGESTTETERLLSPTMVRRQPNPITIETAKLGTTITLTLNRIKDLDRAVRGQVVDEAGNPIPLVEVSRMAYPEINPASQYGDPNQKPLARTLTDENGRYQLAFQSETPLSYFCAIGEGWAATMLENVRTGTAAQPAEVNFTLRRGHTLRGVVVNEAGKPVAGARLAAAPTRNQMTVNYWPLVREAVTGADGTFTLTGLSSHTVALQVSGPSRPIRMSPGDRQGGGPGRLIMPKNDWASQVIERQDVDCSITLTLQSPLVIRGRVLDRETGQPVPSFNISGQSEVPRNGNRRGPIYRLRSQPFTAGDGRFELQEPMLEQDSVYQMVIKGEGYMITEVLDLKAEPAATATEHVIRITRGRPLRGVVLDAATKAPLKDATVYFASGGDNYSGDQIPSSSRQDPKRNQVTARTGANGRFSFTEDVPGLLFIVARGYRHALVRPAERGRYNVGQGELWIQLARGESVSGVCLENGRPAKAHTVVSIRHQDVPIVPEDYPFIGYVTNGGTDDTGKFTIDDLRPGNYLLRMRWQAPPLGSRFYAEAYRALTIKEGEHKTINIGDDRGTLNFKGRLLDAQGKPADSATLRLKPAFPWTYAQFETYVPDRAPDSGRFHFPNLKPGKYNVEVAREREDFTEEITPLPPVVLTGDTERELRLPPK